MTSAQKRGVADALARLTPQWFCHGGCVGADAEADAIARRMGADICLHPANIRDLQAVFDGERRQGRLPPLVRNRIIVAHCEMLIATPREADEVRRSGTWATIRYAREAGKPVVIILPDGRWM